MDNLLGDEERELSFFIAEHCRDMFSLKSTVTSAATMDDGKDAKPASDTLSHSIAIVLANCGWVTLVDIHAALNEHHFSTTSLAPNQHLSEDALRSEVKRMVHHDLIRYDSRTGRYALNVLFASMRILFPLMASSGVGSGGAVAAEVALHALYEHHDLPLAVLSNMVSERLPGVGSAAVDRAILNLQNEGWIVQISATGGAAAATSAGSNGNEKESKKSASAAASSLVSSFGINYAKFLARYRSEVVVKYACENMTPTSRSIAQHLADRRKPEAQFQLTDSAETNPVPRLPMFGDDVNTAGMKARAGTNLVGVVRGLTQETQPVVQIVSSKDDGSVTARFAFDAATQRIRRSLMCGEVRARFGHLGQRVIKILFDHRALEDKSIAEESLVSLQDLHNLLLPMQQLGIISQQELLKAPAGGINVALQIAANSGPDRNVKQSIFLWTIQERNLLALVRTRICKSICAMRMRLRTEWRESVGGTAAEAGGAAGTIRQRQEDGASSSNKRQNFTVGQAERQRFEVVQDHLAKALAALYEELAVTTFF